MKTFKTTMYTEGLKILKSKIFIITIILFIFIAFMMGLLVFIEKYPEISSKFGMIGTKATMLRVGEPVWKNYFTLISQGLSGIGLIGFGFIACWIFGREYSDNTIKDLLALPVPRSSFVTSKLVLVAAWSVLLAIVFISSAFIMGFIFKLDGRSVELTKHFLVMVGKITVLSVLLSTPVALLASFSKGYLLPVGFLILTMMLANFSGLAGLGPYFPWSVPGMLTSPAGAGTEQLKPVSYFIVIATSILGYTGTLLWWNYADQK